MNLRIEETMRGQDGRTDQYRKASNAPKRTTLCSFSSFSPSLFSQSL